MGEKRVQCRELYRRGEFQGKKRGCEEKLRNRKEEGITKTN